jgi:uncharacterized protein (DUF885 family)
MIPTRRQVLAGAGAMLLPSVAPAAARADRALRGLLDVAATSANPAAMVERLMRIDPATLSPDARLDLLTALSGLHLDAALVRQFPNPAAPMTPARYRLLLCRLTSDDAVPAKAQRRLERERRRLTARADQIMRRLGHGRGTIGARYATLWRDSRWLYNDDEAGRDRAVADMTRTLALTRAEARLAFPEVPAYCFDVTVQRLSPADLAAGKGGYRTLPTPTGPGAYVVDLTDIRRRPSWTLPSMVRHELLPGHMIQLPLEAAADPHALRLRYAPGFAEGWATYIEQCALDAGAYADDPLAELGSLHWLLFRVCRALVDLRVHLSGWAAERAIAQWIAWQGEAAYFAPFDVDVKRIVNDPALRVAEALAWLTMDDLASHDAAGLHRVALGHGRMRLDLLRGMVAASGAGSHARLRHAG